MRYANYYINFYSNDGGIFIDKKYHWIKVVFVFHGFYSINCFTKFFSNMDERDKLSDRFWVSSTIEGADF
jgi:hypothetical protein